MKKNYLSILIPKNKKPEKHSNTMKLNIFVQESYRKLKSGLIELYGNSK